MDEWPFNPMWTHMVWPTIMRDDYKSLTYMFNGILDNWRISLSTFSIAKSRLSCYLVVKRLQSRLVFWSCHNRFRFSEQTDRRVPWNRKTFLDPRHNRPLLLILVLIPECLTLSRRGIVVIICVVIYSYIVPCCGRNGALPLKLLQKLEDTMSSSSGCYCLNWMLASCYVRVTYISLYRA